MIYGIFSFYIEETEAYNCNVIARISISIFENY